MNPYGLTLPLRIKRLKEAFGITDAAGRAGPYVYFAVDAESRNAMKRIGPEEAETIAKLIARTLTDVIEAGRRGEG